MVIVERFTSCSNRDKGNQFTTVNIKPQVRDKMYNSKSCSNMVKGFTLTTENILQQEFKLKCKAVNM